MDNKIKNMTPELKILFLEIDLDFWKLFACCGIIAALCGGMLFGIYVGKSSAAPATQQKIETQHISQQ